MADINPDGRSRTYYTWDNQVNFQATDPYGFWGVTLKHGQLSSEINSSQYTSFDEAFKAVKAYYDSKKEELFLHPVVKPELKTKAKG